MKNDNLRMRQVQSPVIPLIGNMIAANPGTISLGQGVVYYPPPPEALEALNSFGSGVNDHKYGPADGLPILLDRIFDKLQVENGIAIDNSKRVMVTAGANMAFLTVLCAIADPEDEIILLSPYYFNQEMAIRMLNAVPVVVDGDLHCQPDLNHLRSAITSRTRAIVSISPNNPSGVVYTEETLRAINALCAQNNLYHINDEAYEYFLYGTTPHYSPASDPNAASHTISLFSMSKAYGFASWRIGYMVIPEHLHSSVLKVQDTNLICAPGIAQHAAAGALTAGKAYCLEKLETIRGVRERLLSALAQLGDSIRIIPGDGALYVLVELATTYQAMDLVEILIRNHGVAVIPGNTFGLSKGCYLRISFGALDETIAHEGIDRLIRGLQLTLGLKP